MEIPDEALTKATAELWGLQSMDAGEMAGRVLRAAAPSIARAAQAQILHEMAERLRSAAGMQTELPAAAYLWCADMVLTPEANKLETRHA